MPEDPADDPTGASTDDHPAADGAVLDRSLPGPLADRASAVYGREVATLGDWARAVRGAIVDAAGRPPTADDLCHAEGTDHVARVDGDSYAFLCPLDAMVYPHLVGSSGTVETVAPDGTTLTVGVDPDGTLDPAGFDPGEAVVSLGVPDDASEVACCPDCADPADYEALCAYVRAFPDRATYEAWAADVEDAATTAVPLAAAPALTRALATGT